jgi:hypothetical protein
MVRAVALAAAIGAAGVAASEAATLRGPDGGEVRIRGVGVYG